jgi:chemotaxis signal transduction protein
MNDNIQPSNSVQLPTGQNNRLMKLLIFKIGKLNVALSVDIVKKITHHTPVYNSGLNHMGMAVVDDREITVVDLHKRLFNVAQETLPDSRNYLAIARNSVGETFGITMGQAPTLQDVPVSQIRTLPESYRQADTLEVASHVTVIPQQNGALTVFILDPDRVVPPVSGILNSSSEYSFSF